MGDMTNPDRLVPSKGSTYADEHSSCEAELSLLNGSQYQIDGQGSAVSPKLASQNGESVASVDLAIQSKAISVSYHSEAVLNPEVIGLAAQVKLLAEQLAQLTTKLDEANYKIGFLEAKTLAQRLQIRELESRLDGKNHPHWQRFAKWLKNSP